jgi:RNA polymerase sigma-70 factor (ECF subfamily)
MEPMQSPVDDLLRSMVPDAERGAAAASVTNALARARAVHPTSWISDADFARHLLEHARDGSGSVGETVDALHAADLYFALACARGVEPAISAIESEHFAHVGDFIARVDSSKALADEVRQRLRHRLLVSTPETPAKIFGYTGRGPLGGWLRVCAVREAQMLKKDEGRGRPLPDADLTTDMVDPELVILKDRYGDAVSAAFKGALEKLDADHRTMLRMHYVDGLTIEQVGRVFRVSRATAARMLLKARDSLVESVRERLHDELGVDDAEAQSLLELVRSRIDLSLRRHLT